MAVLTDSTALSDWEAGPPQARLVSIGTHDLYLASAGPPRQEGQPIMVILTGIASSIKEWPAAIRALSSLTRTYSYERSGYGASGSSPFAPTAEQIVNELDLLLTAAQIRPPYILVAHSYAGVVAREFAHRRLNDVCGIVFVDANTEETHLTYPRPVLDVMADGLNFLDVCVGDQHALTQAEWLDLLDEEASAHHNDSARKEIELYHSSGKALGARKQLDLTPPLLHDRPIFILNANFRLDMERIYHAGCAAGNGTQQDRESMLQMLEGCNAVESEMQRKLLKLSSKARFAHVAESGHQIAMVAPDRIADAARWCLENLSRDS